MYQMDKKKHVQAMSTTIIVTGKYETAQYPINSKRIIFHCAANKRTFDGGADRHRAKPNIFFNKKFVFEFESTKKTEKQNMKLTNAKCRFWSLIVLLGFKLNE